MNFAFIDLEKLHILYERGHIDAAGLTAIAPIQWLAEHYPELLENPGQAVEATREKPKTCKQCIHYSSIHQCCMTRIDEINTYLPVKDSTEACQDFTGVQLPYFLKTGGNP